MSFEIVNPELFVDLSTAQQEYISGGQFVGTGGYGNFGMLGGAYGYPGYGGYVIPGYGAYRRPGFGFFPGIRRYGIFPGAISGF